MISKIGQIFLKVKDFKSNLIELQILQEVLKDFMTFHGIFWAISRNDF